jgi:D-serine deaminase-like pyridoxal phosphate-dependent protein
VTAGAVPGTAPAAAIVGDVLINVTELPTRVTERIEALRNRPIDATEKAFSFQGGRTAASIALAGQDLHAAGLSYPVLTLRETALAHNAQAMAAYCAGAGVELAPHGKTAMSPELAALQVAHGAWAITVATIGQMRTYRGFGFPRLLLANELADETGIAWLAAELAADPGFEPYCYVDNLTTINLMDRTIRATTPGASLPVRPLPVLVEIGHDGAGAETGRTGCRTDAEAIEVAKAAAATGTLRVAGVAGYEGSIGHDASPETTGRVTAFCRRLRGLADVLREPGEFVVSAGGSTWFDIVTSELTAGDTSGLRLVLRSGAYLTHDHGMYDATSPWARGDTHAPRFRPAIEIWAQVVSRPEPGLALVGLGRRDAGFDAGLPVPLRASGGQDVTGWTLTRLMDQHAYLQVGADATLAPGDLICFGISHPCTTLDKWRVMAVVDDDGRVTDVVHAFF